MSFARSADGARLYYQTQGAGPALLLLAGQCCDHREWERVASDFARDFQVITWDYRGTGQSDKPAAPAYSTRGFAADAIAVLDDLAVERAHVYGVSMGGRVAQWLAVDHAQRLVALVLGATTPGNAYGVRRSAAADKALRSTDVVALLETSFTPTWIAANRELAENIAASWSAPLPAHARRLHYQASEGHDAWDALPGISKPVLVIHGSEDEINLPENARLLAQRIPGAELCILPGARHGYFEEMREASFAVVHDFLLRHPP